MHNKVIEFNKAQRAKKMPSLAAGDVVKVYRKIKEGDKERVQIFQGLVVAVKGGQSASPMITVRKVSQGIGVELILPIFSPGIEKIELVKQAKVRRSKLYYLRKLTAKKSRMKYSDVAEFIPEEVAETPLAGQAVAEEAAAEIAEEKKEAAK